MPASKPEAALKALFERIGGLVDSAHGLWLSSLRLHDIAPNDQLLGWRARNVFFYGEMNADRRAYRQSIKRFDSGFVDESTRNHARQAGTFRATLLVDHVAPDFFDGDFFRFHYIERGITDRLFVILPVNEDVESFFMFDRLRGQAAFTHRELDIVVYALRSLAWFNRQIHLSYGQLVAEKPLTPMERRVLRSLLAGRSEKVIASAVEQSPHTTHQHVKTLFRKFNVKSRAELTALWLGH